MRRITFTYRVVVWDIMVDAENYSFQYQLFRNEELVEEGEENDDHSWPTPKEQEKFKQTLTEGWAHQLVIEKLT